MDILKIKNADIYRGLNKVFEDFSMTLPMGRNTAIVGPNGVGKTTLLQTISREIYPHLGTKGSSELFGQSTWDVFELRKRLGLVSLDLQHNFNRRTSGAGVVRSGFSSNLAEFENQAFTPDELATSARWMEELAITHLGERPYMQMSTGERRRFLLARALVNDPEAMILDEPTTGLDLPATFQYLKTVTRLIDRGKTVIVVTHHLHEIAPKIDYVILLKSGRVLAEGPKRDVLTDDNLSCLFDIPIQVACESGYYRALPR